MAPGDLAESLIEDLGISDPKDLDVEAISMDAGMMVRYRKLDGCAATLVGVRDRAIATISPSDSPGRDRFSIGHELGHWMMHRGRSFVCRTDDIGENIRSDKEVEKAADTYSAHLLMPSPLIKPATRGIRSVAFSHLEQLSSDFHTSLVATAFRIVRLDIYPIILACYTKNELKWSVRSASVPSRWWLKPSLDPDSFAFDLIHRDVRTTGPGKQSAEAWFSNDDADKYEVIEDCSPYRSGQVLVVLQLSAEMLELGFDQNLWTGRKINT